MAIKRKISIYDLGVLSYKNACCVQNTLHDAIVKKIIEPTIIFVEHPPVITLGKNSNNANILSDIKVLKDHQIELVHCDRGGEVTMHMPGQLLIYPILPLAYFENSVRSYIEFLEESICSLLQSFLIKAGRDKDNPGVWVGSKKIAAIGVRVKNRHTLHGASINISNDLSLYKHIIPCGLVNKGVTSIQNELLESQVLTVQTFSKHFFSLLQKKFSIESPFINKKDALNVKLKCRSLVSKVSL